jgi:hypothetical protein
MGRRQTSSASRPAAVYLQPPVPGDLRVELAEGSPPTTASRVRHGDGLSRGREQAVSRLCLSNSTRVECLKQILHAFGDIADRDDIHQASLRLEFVQQWIKCEAGRAAADPIFVDPPPV